MAAPVRTSLVDSTEPANVSATSIQVVIVLNILKGCFAQISQLIASLVCFV